MNDRERDCIVKMLSIVEDEDLWSLTQTISNRLLVPESRKEATDTILHYTDSLESFLRRKKIKREKIAKFLHDKNMLQDAFSSKEKLISQVLLLCGSVQQCGSKETDAEVDKDYEHRTTEESTECRTGNAQDFAIQFTKWFFDMLNHFVAVRGSSGEYGACHFWNDCSLQVSIISNQGHDSVEVFENGSDTAIKLPAILHENNFILLPNNNYTGTRGKIDPHGVIMVMVCGTVHKQNENNCVGLFEQLFGLIRDPSMEDKWKIKYIQLRITGKVVSAEPEIESSALAALLN